MPLATVYYTSAQRLSFVFLSGCFFRRITPVRLDSFFTGCNSTKEPAQRIAALDARKSSQPLLGLADIYIHLLPYHFRLGFTL